MSPARRRRRASAETLGLATAASRIPRRSSSRTTSSGSASPNRARNAAPPASCSSSLICSTSRSSRDTTPKGTSLVCDSHVVQNVAIPELCAILSSSRQKRLLPMPAGPTTPTTEPCPSRPLCRIRVIESISSSRPTRVDSRRPIAVLLASIPRRRRAYTGSGAFLMFTNDGSSRTAMCSTSRTVDSLIMTPPAGATDSIRCAIPTCVPNAV